MARERDFEMVEQPVQYSVTYNLSFSGVWGQSKPVSTFYNAGAWRRILVGVCHHDNSWVSHPSLAKLWAAKTVKYFVLENINPANWCNTSIMFLMTMIRTTKSS